jgi:glycosyltransferase involved in cell wall biosynthesis
MHVLQLNKFLYGKGGAETVMFRTAELLQEHGHEVSFFAMQDPENKPCAQAKYFPRGRYYGAEHGSLRRARDAVASIYSLDARRALRRMLDDHKPDVAHLHNVYHQLSLSVIDELQAHRVPIVLTVHDCKPVCPNYKLYTKDEPCRRCVGSHPAHAIVHRCIKGSLLASTIGTVETMLTRTRRVYNNVDAFIVPSRHLAEVMIDGGLPDDRIQVIPNFVSDEHFGDIGQRAYPEPMVLFVGRLEADKGIEVLLTAAGRVADRLKVTVVGGGPLESEVRAAERMGVVEYLGRREWPEIAALMDRARAVVIPSLVEENCPMVALEASARGCAVIGSDRGGLLELIDEEQDGLLFAAGNPEVLATAMLRVGTDASLAARMGAARHARTRAHNTADAYLSGLLSTYRRVSEAQVTA